MATPKEILQAVRDQGWDREKIIELIELLMKEAKKDSVPVQETNNGKQHQKAKEDNEEEKEKLVQEKSNLKGKLKENQK